MFTDHQKFLGALLLFSVFAVGSIWFYGRIAVRLEAERPLTFQGGSAEEEWEAARQHLYCQVLAPGQTRDQIENDLVEMGEYEFLPTVQAGVFQLRFENPVFNLTMGQITLQFSRGRLAGREVLTLRGQPVPLDC
jgi:hypothetical protein